MSNELSASYAPAGALADGTRVLVAKGNVPEGIPVELHIDGRTNRTTAIYADGSAEDYGPSPSAPGETVYFADE